MAASRIVAPQTQLATIRRGQTTTLTENFAVSDASANELYAAMDRLLRRQGAIERKLGLSNNATPTIKKNAPAGAFFA